MRKFFYLMLSNIFISVQIFAQVETTNLVGIESGSGTVTRTYAMTDAGRVKNGVFKVVKTMTDPKTAGSSYKLTISGNYKNDLPDGTWTYSLSTVQFPTLGGDYSTGSITLTQIWTNGVANGTWTYANSRSFKKKNVNFRTGTYTWSEPFKNANDTKNETITFKNGAIQLTTGTYDGAKVTCLNGIPVSYYKSIGDRYISQNIKNGFATEQGNDYSKGNYKISYTPEQEEVLKQHGDSLVKLYNNVETTVTGYPMKIVNKYTVGDYISDVFFGAEFFDSSRQYEIPDRDFIAKSLKPFMYYVLDFKLLEAYTGKNKKDYESGIKDKILSIYSVEYADSVKQNIKTNIYNIIKNFDYARNYDDNRTYCKIKLSAFDDTMREWITMKFPHDTVFLVFNFGAAREMGDTNLLVQTLIPKDVFASPENYFKDNERWVFKDCILQGNEYNENFQWFIIPSPKE